MEVALQIIAIAISLLLFWTGTKKLDISKWVAASLEILNALVLIAFTFLLGWLGIALAIASVGIMIVVYSLHLAVEHYRYVTHPHASSGISKENLKALSKRLQRDNRSVKTLGPMRTAELLRHLADCSRDLGEMEPTARAIATMWFAHNLMEETDLKALARKFGRFLRLWDKPAAESMEVADMLTRTVKRSPATCMEMLDSMISFALSDEAG